MALRDVLPELVRRAGGRQAAAGVVGVGRSAVNNWLQGIREPSLDKLIRLLDHVGADDATRAQVLHADSAVTPSTRRPAPIVHPRTVRRVRRGRAA